MKKPYFVVLAAALTVGIAAAIYYWTARAPATETIARVGNESITTQEFLHRYWEYLKTTGIKDNLGTRHIVLKDMINERLMKIDALSRGWGSGPEFERQVNDATTQVLLDTYRRRAVNDTVTVTEEEVRQTFARSRMKLGVRHLYARTEDEARKFKELLDRGETFETLAKAAFRDPRLASNGGFIGYIGQGDTDPAFEDAAYALPVGAISDPVKTEQGYSIIKVEKKVTLPLAGEYDFESQRSEIMMALRQKKILESNLRFAQSLINAGDVKFNEPVIDGLLARWDDVGLSDGVERWDQPAGVARLQPSDIVLTHEGSSWTVQDVLDRLKLTSARQRDYVQSAGDLREFIIGLMTRDRIVQKAKEAGFDREPHVQGQIQQRIDYYLWTTWRAAATDSVAYQPVMPAGLTDAQQAEWTYRHNLQEAKFRQHFDAKTEIYRFPDEVRVREIYTLSNPEALEVMKHYLAGKDFGQLARRYSKRPWAAVRGGDMGFHTREEYGVLGDKIFEEKQGTLIGPVPVDSGYSLIQVLERRPGREKTFEEAKDEMYERFLPGWQNIAFSRALASLQQRIAVSVDSLKLESIPFIDPMMLVQGE